MDSLAIFLKKIQEDNKYDDIRETLKMCNEINEAKKVLDKFERNKQQRWKTITTSNTPTINY